MHSKMKNAITAVIFSLGAGTAQAATTYNNNFTMLDPGTGLTGGTNDVTFSWDGSVNTSFQDNGAGTNAALASAGPTLFFYLPWTAYNVSIYGPGTYTISTADTYGSADCPYVAATTCATGGDYHVTVGGGQVMAHMKFAWSTVQGIDVINVWQAGDWTLLNAGNPIWTGGGGAYTGPSYNFVSTDWNGDGIAGGSMVDGPFPGFNANFNVNVVPVPAAVWLFGSGLLGLAGLARRRKKSRQ